MPAYDNTAVAAKLELYADLLEVSGADKYRFLSYRKAANSLRAWPEQVSALAADGRLTEVPGVGAKMAGVIAELVERGSFSALDELAERFPLTLAGVMRVPGVGPKRAALLYERLGVASIQDLERALGDGRVERLGGFGAKTAAKIAASLESHQRHTQRRPIGEALPAAEQLLEEVRRVPGVVHASLAGSVRRRVETVGDIDVVVASEDPLAALRDLGSLPAVERVIEQGDSAITFELHDGFTVDLVVVPPVAFGAALAVLTGSAAHVGLVRDHAAVRGCTLSLDGLSSPEGGLPAPDEESVFELLGLPVLPPEVREGPALLGDASIESFSPELVTLADVRGDLQSHSTFTDGKATLAGNREVARELGYEYLAATDHAYNLRMVGGLDLDGLERQWAEIDELNATGDGPLILKGIELNIAEDGSVDYDDEVLARFDIALASLHGGWDQDEETITARMLAAIAHPLVDVIAHPTGRILGRRDPLRLDMRRVLEAAGSNGTLMEINSYPDRLDLSEEHIRLARSFGVRFTLGTDAHAPVHLRYMPYGVAQARRGLVSPHELLNAHPWVVARTWLKRNRGAGG